MEITFLDGIKTVVKGLSKVVEGNDYLPWARAYALAGRPQLNNQLFDGKNYLEFFGGAVVATETNGQVVYLPVQNAKMQPIGLDILNPRDINDAIERCRTKAISIAYGVGMCLYGGFGDDVGAFIRAVGVKPDTDLDAAEAATSVKPGSAAAKYVDWASAVTAAKITDPNFRFNVIFTEGIDPATGEIKNIPARKTGTGWMVEVEVEYKGRKHIEWLPIMGVVKVETKNGPKNMDHKTIVNPSINDWNKAVMRCLVKAIAMVSGYGISVYAQESVENLEPTQIGAKKPQVEPEVTQKPTEPEVAKVETEQAKPEQKPEVVQKTAEPEVVKAAVAVEQAKRVTEVAKQEPNPKNQILIEFKEAMEKTGRNTPEGVAKLIKWLGESEGTEVDDLPIEKLEKALKVMKK